MPLPLVSVVVPVYNVQQYIQRCARSLMEQSYSNLELIFVDDCSPDDSIASLQDEIEKHPERAPQVKILHHDRNRGLAHARQTGCKHAAGKYLLNVDSDDWLDLDAVEKLVTAAESTDAEIVVFNMTIHRAENKTIKINQTIPPEKDKYLLSALSLSPQTSISMCIKLFRKDLLDKVDLRLPEYCIFGEDYLVFPQILLAAEHIAVCPENFYHYDHTVSSSSTFIPSARSIEDVRSVFALLQNVFHEDQYINALAKGQASMIIYMLKQICLNDQSDTEKTETLLELLGKKYRFLSLPNKIFYCLAAYKFKTFAVLYLKTGRSLKNLLKIVKNRK